MNALEVSQRVIDACIMKPARIIIIFVVIFVLAITAVGVISEIVAGTHGFPVAVPPEAIKYFQQ